ncbi:MAG: FGGY-family carbohydrate kinase, partial [Actinomycetota bacterium]
MSFLGIDIGTSGCKAVVFDEDWNIISDSYKEYSLISYGESSIELDPEIIWQRTKEAITEANSRLTGISRVRALAVSAIGDVIVPLGNDLNPVRPSIVDFDIRGKDEIAEFAREYGAPELFQTTGMPPIFISSLAKILYIKRHEPDNYKKISRWATYEDYVLHKLGAGFFVSHSLASRTMLFDIRKKTWAQKILNEIGLTIANLPEPIESAKIISVLNPQVAGELGFKGEVRICSGGHDMVCAALGAGLDVNNPETAVDINGTIEGIITAFKEANTNNVMLENLYPCYPGYKGYVSFSVNLTSGCVIKWHMDNIARDLTSEAKKNKLDEFDEIRKNIDPQKLGSLIYIPHFSGSGNPYFNTNSKGCIYGLNLNTGQDDLIKGLYEGLCYEIRYQLDAYKEAGINIEKLIAVGKGSKSREWMQLKANITGREFTSTAVHDASSMGAAALAATASGFLDNPTDATKSIEKKSIVFDPDSKVQREADEKYFN